MRAFLGVLYGDQREARRILDTTDTTRDLCLALLALFWKTLGDMAHADRYTVCASRCGTRTQWTWFGYGPV